MTYATPAQIGFIASLVAQSDYASVVEAVDAYGFGLKGAGSLTCREASEVIDFLKASTTVQTPAYVAAVAKADADRAAFLAKYPHMA